MRRILCWVLPIFTPSQQSSISLTFLFYSTCSRYRMCIGAFLQFQFQSQPTETSNHHIGPNKGGLIIKKNNKVSLMKSKFFLNWMVTIDQQSQFQFGLEQVRHAIICTVKKRFCSCRKRTVQYLIEKFVLDMASWTAFHQKNDEGFSKWFYIWTKRYRLWGVGREQKNNRKRTANAQFYQNVKSVTWEKN